MLGFVVLGSEMLQEAYWDRKKRDLNEGEFPRVKHEVGTHWELRLGVIVFINGTYAHEVIIWKAIWFKFHGENERWKMNWYWFFPFWKRFGLKRFKDNTIEIRL